jgi:hypothetical protein
MSAAAMSLPAQRADDGAGGARAARARALLVHDPVLAHERLEGTQLAERILAALCQEAHA